MKKIPVLILILALALAAFSTSASAAPVLSVSADPSGAAPGETLVISVSVSDLPESTSLALSLRFDHTLLEYADSGNWLVSGIMQTFDRNAGNGVIAFGGNNPLSGSRSLFTITMRVKAYGASSLSVQLTSQNRSVREDVSASGSVTVGLPCPGHQFSEWTVTRPACTQEGEESRSCTLCTAVETRPVAVSGHKWSDWTVTTPAGCETEGLQERRCENCGEKESRSSPALGHKIDALTVTKEPSCTETGIRSGTCDRCHLEATETIAALGHAWGAWTTTKQPTCTEAGEQTRACTRCRETITRPAAALGHDFEDPHVVREATLSQTGLVQGKCRRCNETTDQVFPCRAEDASSGVAVTAEEGAFPEGAAFSVTKVAGSSEEYEALKTAFADLTDTFTVYDLAALLNGNGVQPATPVTLTFPIPEGYSSQTLLYGFSENGTPRRLEAELSDDGKLLTLKSAELTRFALADLAAGTQPPTPTEPTPDSSSLTPVPSRTVSAPLDTGMDSDSVTSILIIGALVLVTLAAAALVYFKKRR